MKSIELSATAESPESASSLFTTPKCRSERRGFYQSLCSWGVQELGRLEKLQDIRLYYLDQTPLDRLRGRAIHKLKSMKMRLIRRGLRAAFGELRFLESVRSSRRLTVNVGEYFGPINCNANPAVYEPRDSSSFGTLPNSAAGVLGDSEVDGLAEEFKAEVISPFADLKVIIPQEVAIDAEQAKLLAISGSCLEFRRKIQDQRSIAEQKEDERLLHQADADAHLRKMRRYEYSGMLEARPYRVAKRKNEVQKHKAELALSMRVAAILEERSLRSELISLERTIDQRVDRKFWPLEDHLHSLKAALRK